MNGIDRKDFKNIGRRFRENGNFRSPKKAIPLSIYLERPSIVKGCRCIDSTGSAKNLYDTVEDARRSASGAELEVYPCPYTLGWHLRRR